MMNFVRLQPILPEFYSTQLVVERLMKDWTSPVYAFFKPIPLIGLIDGRRVHIFTCIAKRCRGKGRNGREVRRYLGTSDSTSTSNLRRHAKACWGESMVKAAGNVKNAHAARAVLAKSSGSTDLTDGLITAAFERINKRTVTYSTRQLTKSETRCVSYHKVPLLKVDMSPLIAPR
jgi:hypothetical protein